VTTAPSAQRLLERGASELRKAGIPEPRFEAELLLRHAFGWSREALFARLHEPAGPEAAGHYFQLLERRLGRVPIQHILGTQEFYGLSFHVTPSVLIPRPETEGVVDEALKELADRPASARIADVGCGSGCIGIVLACERPEAAIFAIDASAAALAVARENAAFHGVDNRVTFLHGDLLQPLLERGERVDLLVSNPPYVVESDIEGLAPEVKEHEPRIALAGGADGLSTIRRLIAGASAVLTPNGIVVIEIGEGQSHPVAEEILAAGLDLLRIVPDLAGIPRVVVARRR
jgi:release factor glutamine methyltransferase